MRQKTNTRQSSRPGRLRRGAAMLLISTLLAGLSSGNVLGFGQNKINYEFFDWKVYHAPHFDVYYYPEEAEFVQQMVRYAESAYLQLSKYLDHEVKTRIPLIFFKTHAEFEQTNIILSFIPEAVGAFAEPIENRMVLPIDLPPDDLYALTVHELTHIFWYSILFQGQLRRSFRANPPLWLSEGLAEHMADQDDSLDGMVIRDAVVNNNVPPITRVSDLSFLTYRFGEAAFEFIEREYGAEGIRNLLFEYRKVLLTNNLEKAIKETFGIDAAEFDRLFQRYLREEYYPILLEKKEPYDYGREIGIRRSGVFTFSPSLSPSGELLAVLTTRWEDVDVVILSARDGTTVRNLTKGFSNEYEYISTAIFKGQNDISWSPTGDNVAFFARKEDKRLLFVVNALTGKTVHKVQLPVAQIASPAFSEDGTEILFSGNDKGVVDIFRYNLETEELVNVTQDGYYDSNPQWSPDGTTVVYNRRINQYEKIFLVDLQDAGLKTQLTFGDHSDIQPHYSLDAEEIYYSSDANEERIHNIYTLSLETGEIKQWTDVLGGNFTPVELFREEATRTLAVTVYAEGRYRLFRMAFNEPVDTIRPEDQDYEPVEIVPFEPPLQLTLNDEQHAGYDKLKWHFEGNPSVAIGVANDGSVLSNAQLVFADLFGDHRIFANFASVQSFSSIDIAYINYKRRLDWYARGIDFRSFYVVSDSFGSERVNKAQSLSGIMAGLIYPFDKFHRIDVSFGAYQRDQELPVGVDLNGDGIADGIDFKGFSGTYPMVSATFTGDNTRYKANVGAWHGTRYALTAEYAPVSSGDFGAFANFFVDWRNYQKITARSLFATRFFAAVSNGEVNAVDDFQVISSQIFSIGGFNQMRGYEYREFFGDRASFLNLEIRFPLLEAIIIKGNFGIPAIQGIIFVDVGTAYFRGDLVWDGQLATLDPFTGGLSGTGAVRPYDFYGKEEIWQGRFDADGVWRGEYDPDTGQIVTDSRTGLVDGRASYGFGLNFFFGPFLLNWSFAHRLPFLETLPNIDQNGNFKVLDSGIIDYIFVEQKPSGYRSSFYIGARF